MSRTPAGGRTPPTDTYDPTFFTQLFAIEDRHFWFQARNRVIGTVVDQLTRPLPTGYRVLEVGCGTGNVLRLLERRCRRGTVVGMDLFAEGLHYARQRTTCGLVQGDVRTPPFGPVFDLIGLFDVLEHLPDDRQILGDLHRMLVPGGHLLVTVPAHRALWSYFDEAAHHRRRYAAPDLRRKLVAAGYRVDYLTQYMALLFPLVWAGRRLAALTDGGRTRPTAADAARLTRQEFRITPGVNEVLTALLAPETRLIARRRVLPLGTSLLAVATKLPC
jgi:SAM-dependent methyltransferase